MTKPPMPKVLSNGDNYRSASATTTPTAVELFAGAGGLGEGLASVGIHIVLAQELHPQPALTYAFNHPNTDVLFGDIHQLSMEYLTERLYQRTGSSTVDLVAGGPPCQGFSTAGKKITNDPRNSLFQQFARVVSHLRPRMFLMENVPGFKKMHDGVAFSEAVKIFTALGYRLMDTILDAADFGVPQRRLRFLMVGWLPDLIESFSWPSPTHCELNRNLSLFGDSLAAYETVENTLEDIAFLAPGWEAHRHRTDATSAFQRARRNGTDHLFNHLASLHRERAQTMFAHIKEGSTITSVPHEYRSAKRTMARLDRSSISNSVLALPDDLIHYRQDRIPTVREMARLQSFDDDYVFFGKRTSGFVERKVDVPQYTQVGNAVPPLLGRALGIALIKALGGVPRDVRMIEERRRRHAWVCGTSGFTGYSLLPEAQEALSLADTNARRWTLPIAEGDVPVSKQEPYYEWKTRPRPGRRRQWCPGVQVPRVPRNDKRSQATS